MRILDPAFQEFGLPATIQSDNGPPFASVGAGGLTQLSVSWIQLGMQVARITPGKPQENGRQERFHRTLEAETARPPRADRPARAALARGWRGAQPPVDVGTIEKMFAETCTISVTMASVASGRVEVFSPTKKKRRRAPR